LVASYCANEPNNHYTTSPAYFVGQKQTVPMKIICYVEKLNTDKSLGITADYSMISANMNKFKIQGLQSGNDYSAFVFQAGRYLAVVANDIENKITMSFIDLKNNEQMAKRISTQFEENLRRIFMKNFYELSKNYKKNYDVVSLEVGIDFSTNIATN
jgi:hypothetical protein